MDAALPLGDESPLVRKLAEVVRLVSEIGRATEAREIYETALSALTVIVGADRSSILLLDEANVARFVAWRGLSDAYREAVEGHFPWTLDDRSAKPILTPDVTLEPTLTALQPMFLRERIRAVAFVPLVYRERLVGKFMLYYEAVHEFSIAEIELANAVAYLVAFAIERGRLYAALEESDRRKDAFLATLAHELRNPLASASSALTLIPLAKEDPSYRGAREVLSRSVSQMSKLVNDLLDVSRITRGVIELDRHPLDLTSVVYHSIASLQHMITAQHQHLSLALEPVWVEADALRIEQVLTNLVHNASKYTPAGGHLALSTHASESGVEIRVEDDGVGIAAEVLPRLFDMFIQADQSLARTRGGLGIGLTIVRELVRLHGGWVRAESAGAGKGSSFTVWLPSRTAPSAAISVPVEPTSATLSRNILVVDDNHDAAAMLALVLARHGHHVETAPDGPTALVAVAAKHPDVVLLDLGLPEMTGYEVARRLRATEPSALRIVAVSGYGQPDDIARARAAGCDAHLTKPIDLAELERFIAA